MTGRWYNEKADARGGITGHGALNPLGTPDLERLVVLVRESAQNSLDAGRGKHVDFSVAVDRLDNRAPSWQKHLRPVESGIPGFDALDKQFRSSSVVLTISDRGASGLGGPIYYGQPHFDNGRDFVNFFRKVGGHVDRDGTGGSYGYGKSIFFQVSKACAVLVDTCCDPSNPEGRRLMGAALGREYTDESGNEHTGRHWWGDFDESIEQTVPLLGDNAAAVSSELGLPGFENGATGTDVVVLFPDLHVDEHTELGPRDAADRLAAIMLWQLWPLMGSAVRPARMSFAVSSNGREIKLPSPDGVPRIKPFVDCLDRISSEQGIKHRVPSVGNRHVGNVELEVTAADPGPGLSGIEDAIEKSRPFNVPYRHVARMRSPQLVVDYVEKEPHPRKSLGYVGVYQATLEGDPSYRAAEPPAHDDWIDKSLKGVDRTIIRSGKLFLTKEVRSFLERKAPKGSSDVEGLGNLSLLLSRLIPSAPGQNNGKSTSTPRGGHGSPKKPKLSGPGRLLIRDGKLHVAQDVSFPEDFSTSWSVSAVPVVILEGGNKEYPSPGTGGNLLPQFLRWELSDGSVLESKAVVSDGIAGTKKVTAVVAIPSDLAVEIEIKVEEVG